MNKVVTIDGPVASGKGTVARILADKLKFIHLDSGVLYRLTALFSQRQSPPLKEENKIAKLATLLPVRFVGEKVFVGEENVSKAIRSEAVSQLASQIAILPMVRAALLEKQRKFLQESSLVADGRDMGTVVFPDAFLKIFLTAPAKERAKRRALQLGFNEHSSEYNRIYQQLLQRDARDQNRAISPLIPAKDAYLLDNSGLNIEQTVEKVLFYYQQANNRV